MFNYHSPLINPYDKVIIIAFITIIIVRAFVILININKRPNNIERAHLLFFLFVISNLIYIGLSLIYLIPRNGIVYHPNLYWLAILPGMMIGFPGSILFRRFGVSIFKLKDILSLQDIMPIFNRKPVIVNIWFINLVFLKPIAEELLLRGLLFYTLWSLKPSISWMIITIFLVFVFQCLLNENIVSIFDNLFRTLLLVGMVIATGSIIPGIVVNASISILQGTGLTTMLLKKVKTSEEQLAQRAKDLKPPEK